VKIYKLRRRSDRLFFGGKESRALDRHDHSGRFYTSEITAVKALETSGRKIQDYDCIVFECTEVDVLNYSEILAGA